MLLAPAGVPPTQCLPGDPGLGRDVTDRATGVDALTQTATAFRGVSGALR
jgi:hypothetical protein